MKHCTLFILALLCSMATLHARPIDKATAQRVGQKFVEAHMEVSERSNELQLVYTGLSDRSEAVFYVFNSGEEGFVIVSADDRFRPIVGYSTEGAFETENMSPELQFYLSKIIEARTSRHAVIFDDTPEEWASVMRDGKLPSRNGGKAAKHICSTLWNQDSPYNLYAPEAGSGPGGRCYAGCVATAMSQVMRHWAKPLQGKGTHSYYCYGYGRLTANYGETTYDWDNMPNRITSSSPQEEIEAIALLMYHCGVGVDMMFSPNGSGAYSFDVPDAINNYFSYTEHAYYDGRDHYTLVEWQNKLKASFDINWPLYYSGYSESGGHAFVCDGYDDHNLFHFNWGWGGSSDGWFVIDEIDYATGAGAVFNFVPAEVYLHMAFAPDNLTVVSHGDNDFSATLTWDNPSFNVHGEAFTSLDQIVVTRNGKIIYTEDNPIPGASMSFTDHYMPAAVTYAVYAVKENAKGLEAVEENVILGPQCTWTIETGSENAQGWTNGYLSLRNAEGLEIAQVTPRSTSAQYPVVMPKGNVYVHWNRINQSGENISFKLIDPEGNEKLVFQSESTNLPNGLLYIANNSCGNQGQHKSPKNLTAVRSGNAMELNWEAIESEAITYLVYRDRILVGITNETNYSDGNLDDKYHNYYVTALMEHGESDPSNLCDTNLDTECETPTNMRYEIVSAAKVKILWDAPQAEGITGYKLYRRTKGEDFKCIKLLTSTSHTDNLNSQPAGQYEYTVTAYFNSNHCESAYATTFDNPELNVVVVNKTTIPTGLTAVEEGQNIDLKWVPAMLAETYDIYRNDSLIATGVVENQFTDSILVETKDILCYTVVGKNAFLESNPSNEAYVLSSASVTNIDNHSSVVVYPNPTSGAVVIEAEDLNHVSVYNMMGQQIFIHPANNGQATIDLSSFPDGSYIIQATTSMGVVTKKIVKIQ